MGKVIIHEETSKNPITLIGKEAGICYGSDVSNNEKNYKRGLELIKSGHGRTLEFPQVYMTLDEYSARTIREFYTHIAGGPTRLQASTRYINYSKKGFDYIIPPSITKNSEAYDVWVNLMEEITQRLAYLQSAGIPNEDLANALPLGMTTKIITRTNARNLIEMSHQRLCTRAYWEYRQLMADLMKALSEYSDEWKTLVELTFKPKCEVYGYCTETKTCGRKPYKSSIC